LVHPQEIIYLRGNKPSENILPGKIPPVENISPREKKSEKSEKGIDEKISLISKKF